MDKEQIKRTLKSLPGKKDNIIGIYNYCDYWCERCMFTSHCANFQISKELGNDSEANDLNNQKFWDNFSNLLEATLELLTEKMAEFGFEPDDSTEQTDTWIKDVSRQPLVKKAKSYSLKVHKWLEAYTKSKTSSKVFHLTSTSLFSQKVGEAIEVITWYSIFISAKTSRAFSSGRYEEDDQYDSDGSVKITIVAIDRSMSAFTQLWELEKEYEDDILYFLTRLSSLKKGLLKRFPDAMDFKRPGFDD
ncbi:MAG: hypothetical protein HXX13_13050 [Bacteroidetes bacterium]|nr:hypothetical protein [Bacteroidota bacterium]